MGNFKWCEFYLKKSCSHFYHCKIKNRTAEWGNSKCKGKAERLGHWDSRVFMKAARNLDSDTVQYQRIHKLTVLTSDWSTVVFTICLVVQQAFAQCLFLPNTIPCTQNATMNTKYKSLGLLDVKNVLVGKHVRHSRSDILGFNQALYMGILLKLNSFTNFLFTWKATGERGKEVVMVVGREERHWFHVLFHSSDTTGRVA